MAEYGNQKTKTFAAAADLSGAQYAIVRISNNAQQVNIASQDIHSSMVGVLQNKPAAAGRHATVADQGKGKIIVGAAVNSTAFLTCNGSGRAVVASSGDMVCARALETAGADGDIITADYYAPFRLSGLI